MPSALAVSAFAPWAVMPLLMIGGAYLCYEGFEKLAHKFVDARPRTMCTSADLVQARSDLSVDLVSAEKAKIKGAVRTDFVLSAEIIVITLSNVSYAPFATQVGVLVGIALIMTAGVYGLVGASSSSTMSDSISADASGDAMVARIQRRIGMSILEAAPLIMRGLSIVGTAAMFLVGGGILVHGIPVLNGWIEGLAERFAATPGIGRVLRLATSLLLDAVIGIVAGALVMVVVSGLQRALRPPMAGPRLG